MLSLFLYCGAQKICECILLLTVERRAQISDQTTMGRAEDLSSKRLVYSGEISEADRPNVASSQDDCVRTPTGCIREHCLEERRIVQCGIRRRPGPSETGPAAISNAVAGRAGRNHPIQERRLWLSRPDADTSLISGIGSEMAEQGGSRIWRSRAARDLQLHHMSVPAAGAAEPVPVMVDPDCAEGGRPGSIVPAAEGSIAVVDGVVDCGAAVSLLP